MQWYTKSERLSLKTILFFIAIVLIAFLPISSFLFFLKNDAFTGYFPPKFFMSESIHAGYLPLWNPYINFGFPQYGDMSGGYWSPITWIIASTAGYNAYTFTIETLFYIVLGGLGIFRLMSSWQLNAAVILIGAVAYMCCGYMVGHLQHFNWLSGAAFLPWCFWSYQLFLQKFSGRHVVQTAVLLYMLVASAHPGISISTAYFFIAYLVYHFLSNTGNATISARLKSLSVSHILLIALFFLLGAGMISGYLDLLPQFIRGEKISLRDSLLHPTNIQSWISALFPFATVKNEWLFNNDISARNCYFSLTLLLFFILSLVNKKIGLQRFLLAAGFLFALLASGGIFKTLAYQFVPFIGYVRLNGEFRIFAIFCFVLTACLELDKYIKLKKSFSGAIQWIYYTIEIAVIAGIIFGLYKAFGGKESFIYKLESINTQNGFSFKLKAFIDAVSFYDTFWMQGIIQLLLLRGIKWCLRFNNWQLLKKILIADMIIACLMNIPFTGVGKASVAQIQSVLNKSPKGIPLPLLSPIKNNVAGTTDENSMVGDWSMYNKQIGTAKEVPYPIILKNMRAYFDKDAITAKENHLDKAFLFIEDSVAGTIQLLSFSPQQMELKLQSNKVTQLILQQNFYPHWYYSNGSDKKELNQYGINFMSLPIEKGELHLKISFEPTLIKYGMLLSFFTLLSCCIWLVAISFKQTSPS
jgi:hypothetical protein